MKVNTANIHVRPKRTIIPLKDINILMVSNGVSPVFPCLLFFLQVCKMRTRRTSMYTIKLKIRIRRTGTRKAVKKTPN